MGLARKAGKLSLGNRPAREAVLEGRSRAIFLASDLSERSSRGIRYAAEEYGVPVIPIAESMDELGMALGKRSGIVSVDDAGFMKKGARSRCAEKRGGMQFMMIKYRVHEVAKDLNVPSKEVVDLLKKYFGDTKST